MYSNSIFVYSRTIFLPRPHIACYIWCITNLISLPTHCTNMCLHFFADTKGQGHAHFDRIYLKNGNIQHILGLLLPSNRKSYIGYRFAYLYLSLASSKCQGIGHAHFNCKHLGNGDRWSNVGYVDLIMAYLLLILTHSKSERSWLFAFSHTQTHAHSYTHTHTHTQKWNHREWTLDL